MNWKQVIKDIMYKHEITQMEISAITGVHSSTINALYTMRNKEPKHSTGELLIKLLKSDSAAGFESYERISDKFKGEK